VEKARGDLLRAHRDCASALRKVLAAARGAAVSEQELLATHWALAALQAREKLGTVNESLDAASLRRAVETATTVGMPVISVDLLSKASLRTTLALQSSAPRAATQLPGSPLCPPASRSGTSTPTRTGCYASAPVSPVSAVSVWSSASRLYASCTSPVSRAGSTPAAHAMARRSAAAITLGRC
jgi:hypothetical protein